MTYIANTCASAPSRPTLLSGFTARLAVWRQLVAVKRQRRSLAGLDAHLLEDIGVTQAQANTESQRGLWDAPATWRY